MGGLEVAKESNVEGGGSPAPVLPRAIIRLVASAVYTRRSPVTVSIRAGKEGSNGV